VIRPNNFNAVNVRHSPTSMAYFDTDTWPVAITSIFMSLCSPKPSALYIVKRHKIQYRLRPSDKYFNKHFYVVVHRQNDKRLCA